MRVFASTRVYFQKPGRTFETGRVELTKPGGVELQTAVFVQVRLLAQRMSTTFFSTLGNADVTQPLVEEHDLAPLAVRMPPKRVRSKAKK